MKTLAYKDFSLKFHRKLSHDKLPSICQFELTFRCGLHCRHCYTDCYNRKRLIKKELSAAKVKYILDKARSSGVLWLCFTGGDPLVKDDFAKIYAFAKKKGFIVTIFTNAYSMNERTAAFLKDNPPFAIEITLNAATEQLYEGISRVKGSFIKTMRGINHILQAGLPLKIKTDVMSLNLNELAKIESFVKSAGLKFNPNFFLHDSLEGHLPLSQLRAPADEIYRMCGKRHPIDQDCGVSPDLERPLSDKNIFRCAVVSAGAIHVDPYGNAFPCNYIRKPSVNLLKNDLRLAQKVILSWIKTRRLGEESPCRTCLVRKLCNNCPGKSILETGMLDGKIDWFCELARYKSEAC